MSSFTRFTPIVDPPERRTELLPMEEFHRGVPETIHSYPSPLFIGTKEKDENILVFRITTSQNENME